MDIVGTHFRPEFINRIDESVVFRPLAAEHIRMICGIQMKRVAKRLSSKELELVVSDAALDRIGAAGFDPVYGARPLKREIQQQVENPLAQHLLAGDFMPGETIYLSVKDDALVFTKTVVKEDVFAVH